MLRSADIALTGIKANILKMDAASNNISNVNTPKYKSIRVPTIESVAGGTRGTPIIDNRDGSLLRESDTGKLFESSNANLAVEYTDLLNAQRTVHANMDVIRTADELLGTLFDIKA